MGGLLGRGSPNALDAKLAQYDPAASRVKTRFPRAPRCWGGDAGDERDVALLDDAALTAAS
jgi:hypothetical protein